MLFLGI